MTSMIAWLILLLFIIDVDILNNVAIDNIIIILLLLYYYYLLLISLLLILL